MKWKNIPKVFPIPVRLKALRTSLVYVTPYLSLPYLSSQGPDTLQDTVHFVQLSLWPSV